MICFQITDSVAIPGTSHCKTCINPRLDWRSPYKELYFISWQSLIDQTGEKILISRMDTKIVNQILMFYYLVSFANMIFYLILQGFFCQ